MADMEIFRDDALYAIEGITRAARESLPARDLEDLLHALCGHFRVAGIAALLTEADTAEFRRCLAESGRTRLRLLALEPEQPPERFRCASQLAAFFDALVAGVDEVALEIARKSPSRWAADDEWEEDFRYARFLHLFLLAGAKPTPEVETALAAFQRADDTGAQFPSTRRTLCEALFARDQRAFDDVLEALVQEHGLEVQERERSGPLLNPARHHTEKAVFVEGLALLGYAEACGLTTRREYPGMPGLVRS